MAASQRVKAGPDGGQLRRSKCGPLLGGLGWGCRAGEAGRAGSVVPESSVQSSPGCAVRAVARTRAGRPGSPRSGRRPAQRSCRRRPGRRARVGSRSACRASPGHHQGKNPSWQRTRDRRALRQSGKPNMPAGARDAGGSNSGADEFHPCARTGPSRRPSGSRIRRSGPRAPRHTAPTRPSSGSSATQRLSRRSLRDVLRPVLTDSTLTAAGPLRS